MSTGENVLTFSAVARAIAQQKMSPKKVFVLGSFAESVLANWVNSNGHVKDRAHPLEELLANLGEREKGSQVLGDFPIPSESTKLESEIINLYEAVGRSIENKYLNPLGFKREDAWFCNMRPITPTVLDKLKAIIEQNRVHSETAIDLIDVNPVSKFSKIHNDSSVKEILSQLKQSQAETIILFGDKPIKHFVSHFSKYKSLSDFGNTLLEYGKLHLIEIDGRLYKVYALTHPIIDDDFKTGGNIWKVCHKHWFVKNRLLEVHQVLKGKNPIFVDKKPAICPICRCRKIAQFSVETPPLSEKSKRKIREGKLILKEKMSANDPKYVCTECELEFFEK